MVASAKSKIKDAQLVRAQNKVKELETQLQEARKAGYVPQQPAAGPAAADTHTPSAHKHREADTVPYAAQAADTPAPHRAHRRAEERGGNKPIAVGVRSSPEHSTALRREEAVDLVVLERVVVEVVVAEGAEEQKLPEAAKHIVVLARTRTVQGEERAHYRLPTNQVVVAEL